MRKQSITTRIARAKTDAIAKAHFAALRPHFLKSPIIAQTLRLIPKSLKPSVSIDVSSYADRVSFTLSLRELASFKDKRLVKLIEAFAGDEWQSRSNDYTYDQPNRDYSFTQRVAVPVPRCASASWLRKHGYIYEDEPLTFELSVYVFAYVKADSAACRIVVTGVEEKVVRTEIKEIVCA